MREEVRARRGGSWYGGKVAESVGLVSEVMGRDFDPRGSVHGLVIACHGWYFGSLR
jgi:hypothetical protein